jgi:hypothetical protein
MPPLCRSIRLGNPQDQHCNFVELPGRPFQAALLLLLPYEHLLVSLLLTWNGLAGVTCTIDECELFPRVC